MIYLCNRLIAIVALFCFACLSSAYAAETQTIKRETKLYTLDMRFPEEFDDPNLDTIIRSKIEVIKNKFIASLRDERDLPPSVPGKSSLNINYQLLYNIEPAVSVKLMVTSFNRGAAHPDSKIYILNFLDGDEVQLPDLFIKKSTYLTKISGYCRKQLLQNKHFDKKWVMEGTSPGLDNFRAWAFSEKGLLIVFNTYQIAPYADGPQTLTIPIDELAAWIKPDILKQVWGG